MTREIPACREIKAQLVLRDPRVMQALKEALVQPDLKDSGEKPGQLVQRVLRATRATQDLPAMLELQAPQDLKDQ